MIGILIQAVDVFFTVLSVLVLARVILSWTGMDYSRDRKMRFLYDTTDPIMEPFRKLLDKWQSGMMMDFSPILALIFLDIVKTIIIYVLGMIK